MQESVYMSGSKKSNEKTISISENESVDNYLRKKAEYYFFKMAARQITEEQMRVEFSKDILTMFLTSVPANSLSKSHIQEMEEHLKENMTFLKTLYPLPKASIINRQIFQGVNQFDHTDKVEFDLLANLGFNYQIKNKDSSRTEILSQTESLLNNLIKCSQQTLNEFTNLLMNLISKKLPQSQKTNFEKLMKQPWKFDLESDITKTHQYNTDLVEQKLFFPSVELFRVVNLWSQHMQQIIEDPQNFINQTEYLKIINGKSGNIKMRNQKNKARIFNKFPQTGQLLELSITEEKNEDDSQQQNSKKSTSTQSSNVFVRIFNKIKQMCSGTLEETNLDKLDVQYKYETFSQSTLRNTFTEPSIENAQKYGNYKFKDSGYMINNYLESLQELGQEIKYKAFFEEQLEFLRKAYIQTIRVVDKNKIKQKYTMEEKKLYSFCQNTYYFMEEIVIERLIFLIQAFLKLKEKSENEYQKCMVFQDIDLIQFHEKSVISAFIIADEHLLLAIHKAIVDLSQQRQCKIAKVENRFATSNNDCLIVLKIKNNPILCQLKLVLEPQNIGPESKQKALGQMNQFLTNIEKATFGPISYLAMILAMKDFRVSYLQSIKKQAVEKNIKLAEVCHCRKGSVLERFSVNTFEKEVKNIISDEGYIKFDCYRNLIPTSFVCGVCQKVIKKGDSVIPVPSCFECGFHICVECSFESDPQRQKSIYAALINSVTRIADPCYFSELQLADFNKMNYNHCFTKDVQMISNGKTEVRKQIHYHIILEGTNFVRYGKMTSKQNFWNEVRQKIDLRTIQQYKDTIKQQKFVGILFRPRELLHQKGLPFIFLIYDSKANSFSKLIYKSGQETATPSPVTLTQIQVSQNDIFIPILWAFGQNLVLEYITKVLQTNPFCVKKLMMKAVSLDHMRLSRSSISHHHIMK